MLPWLLLLSVAALGAGPDSRLFQERRIETRVNADEIAAKTPAPEATRAASKDPFAKLFRKADQSTAVERLELAPEIERGPLQNPTIECGLTVFHVDAAMDPKSVVRVSPWNGDPKIGVKPSGPCAKK
jgi:hypothetical protein